MVIWNVLRAAGIGAYLMLWAAIAWGMIATTGLGATKFARASSTTMHRFLSTAGLTLLGLHLIGVLLDTSVKFKPLDLVIPGRSEFRPLAIAFGIIAMYAIVAIIATSFARKQIGVTWWRRVHLLSIPAFMMALMHGIASGTDTQRPWMFWIYMATGLSTVFLLLVRGTSARPKRAKPAKSTVGAHAAPEVAEPVGATSQAGPPSEVRAGVHLTS